ncbi:hypothetical protein OHT52_31140 [Streptomyces sp. NBC_00247]|uniref:hypothetical protein n=1 Tax=Streptomyces sp. NBC_00247 TaxID=2975689 RepID=UPI002E2E12A9|nr:hypothetical protein [Streptomyces sp. NBC_00247]
MPSSLRTAAPTEEPQPAPRPAVYGVPSPALLARAHRGYARFLDHESESVGQDDRAARRTGTAR